MKRFLSVILSVVLVFSCVAVGFSATAEDEDTATKFAVASDLHYVVPEEELEVINEYEPVFWFANRRAQLENESGFIIDEFLRQCAEDEGCEFVLLPGDLVNDGRIDVQQHIDVAAKLKKFEAETGKQVYVINGNHDNGAGENDFKYDDFIENYYEFGYAEAIETVEGECSYVADLNDDYRLIALDSCDPTKSTEGGNSNSGNSDGGNSNSGNANSEDSEDEDSSKKPTTETKLEINFEDLLNGGKKDEDDKDSDANKESSMKVLIDVHP